MDSVLAQLVSEASHTAPDGLPTLVAEQAAALGAQQAVIYLASYRQRYLQPLAGPGVAVREPLDVDATLAGRAYRTLTVLDAGDAPAHRLWLPLVDGTSRIGVLELALPHVDDAARRSARCFADAVAELVVTRNRCGDAFIRARRRRPMSLAAEMQWSLLPPETFSDRRTTVAGMLEPAYDTAGDAFDYAFNGDIVAFAIIDAMGHGFEATLLSQVALSTYRHSRRADLPLGDIYRAMDEMLDRQFGPDRFVTAQLGELDAVTGVLRWLNAGHPAPVLARGGTIVGPLDCEPTLPVGFGGAVAEVAEYQLEPGDAVLLYTDGVVEARSVDGSFFSETRLTDLFVRALTAELPAAETVRRLSHAILEHQGGELQDDATVFLLTWHGDA